MKQNLQKSKNCQNCKFAVILPDVDYSTHYCNLSGGAIEKLTMYDELLFSEYSQDEADLEDWEAENTVDYEWICDSHELKDVSGFRSITRKDIQYPRPVYAWHIPESFDESQYNIAKYEDFVK